MNNTQFKTVTIKPMALCKMSACANNLIGQMFVIASVNGTDWMLAQKVIGKVYFIDLGLNASDYQEVERTVGHVATR